MGGAGQVVATVFCGDNYFHQSKEAALSYILEQVRAKKPQMLVAGPAFEAGRYGLACVEVCQAVAASLDIPCVTAMAPSNPAVGMYQGNKNGKVLCLPTAESAAGMPDALARMARFVKRLSSGEVLGPAQQEGYIHRGIRGPWREERPGAERAVEMLLAKLGGQPFTTEVPVETPTAVPPAPAVKDLARARIAVVTTSGLVPEGNPDGFKYRENNQWAKYTVEGLRTMQERKWEVRHGGYTPVFVRENANYAVPLDVLRELEDAGVVGAVHQDYYMTGNAPGFDQNAKIGQEMGQELKAAGVDGVLLVST